MCVCVCVRERESTSLAHSILKYFHPSILKVLLGLKTLLSVSREKKAFGNILKNAF